jgi:PAS domain S-box-containing protein
LQSGSSRLSPTLHQDDGIGRVERSSIEELQRRVAALEEKLATRDRELQEVQIRERRFSQIMTSNMVGVLFWHVDGRILDANQRVLDLTGYTREEMNRGEINWLAMTPPEYMAREQQAHRELAESRVCTPFEKEYIRKDGKHVPILIGGAFLEGSWEEGVSFVIDVADRWDALRRLQASQNLFQAFADNSPAVAFIKDTQGRRIYLNRMYRELFQDGDDLIGKTDYDMFPRDVADRLRREDEETLSSRTIIRTESEVPTPDGVRRTWLTYKFPVADEQGKLLVGGVAVDVTPLKQAQQELRRMNEELEQRVEARTRELEQANQELRSQIAEKEVIQGELRRSETRLRKWLDQSVVPIQVMSPEGWTVLVNPAWEKLWGVKFQDMEGRNLLTDPQVEEQGIGSCLRRALAGEAVSVPEVPYVPDKGAFEGLARWCRGLIYPIKNDKTGAVEEIVILHEDVTERRAIEERLREEERVMRNLLDVQEQERKLIAYEIHDGLVQDLIGAQLLLDSLGPVFPDNRRESLSTASSLLRKAIGEARRLISGLRPLVIDERGVVQAIQYLIAEEEERGGGAIHFFHQVAFTRLPPLLEGTLYRIAQEAINNARRHSGSEQIEVWLRQDDENRVVLRIRDYGRGFDPSEVPKDRFGLESIRRRASIFGGTSRVESEIGEGTSITVSIPLDAAT